MSRAALVVALILIAVLPARADFRPPQACVRLAALFGFTPSPSYSRAEAEAVLAQLNLRMVFVPEARQCRAAIKAELKK